MKNFAEGSPGTNYKEVNRSGKSQHDLSHACKVGTKIGLLTPVMNLEVYPNDTFVIKSQEVMLRFESLIWPIYHKLDISIDTYYGTNNMLWSNKDLGFNAFITKGTKTDTSIEWAHCELNGTDIRDNLVTPFNTKYLCEYLGVPIPGSDYEGEGTLSNLEVNVLPIALYYKIRDEFYRRPQVQDEIYVPVTNGANPAYDVNNSNSMVLQELVYVNWPFDYFTMATPSPTYNGMDVLIPLVNEQIQDADGNGIAGPYQWRSAQTGLTVASGRNLHHSSPHEIGGGTGTFQTSDYTGGAPGGGAYLDIMSTAGTIRELRTSEAIQKFYERLNRSNDRFNDFSLGFFGTSPYPITIERPIHLGGRTGTVRISEVMQTASTWEASGPGTGATFTGDYTGQALGIVKNERITFTAKEHGWLQTMVSIRPRSSYYQGLAKKWTRNSWMDYMFPDFAQIGDEAILRKELYFNWLDGDTTNNETFGYVPRFQHLRTEHDTVSGSLREDAQSAYGRDGFHLGRKFDKNSSRTLEDAFLKCIPRTTDVFQQIDSQDDHVWMYVYNDVTVYRKMPKYSIPSI